MKNVKAGDIIVNRDGDEAKLLEVLLNSFLRSSWGNFETTGPWYTYKEAEKADWRIKGTEEGNIINMGGKRYKLLEE